MTDPEQSSGDVSLSCNAQVVAVGGDHRGQARVPVDLAGGAGATASIAAGWFTSWALRASTPEPPPLGA
jgi:hypothetical protein